MTGTPVDRVIRPLPRDTDLLALHRAFPLRYPLLLESVADGTPRARWDLLFIADGSGLRCDAHGAVATLDGQALAGSFLDALDAAWRAEQGLAASRRHAGRDESALPCHGGWALYLGYELVGQIEPTVNLPHPDTYALPTALALRCPAVLLRERASGRVVAVAEPGRGPLLDQVIADIAQIATAATPSASWKAPMVVEEDDPQHFLAGVARVHEHLRAGDTFQVNLSRGWRARFEQAPAPGAVYARLRAANPSPFAASFVQPQWSLASSSPERLISIRERVIETRPIAGTRPRRAGDDEAARVRELIDHPKERAEHVMLIDLERNDLGRVCVPGSVQVDELMAVESYAHVHHIVSNVRGTLRDAVTPGQAIAAVFPGGTITGCPKVRCMQIIAALEGVGRGEYTGALGYLDRNGDLDLNILIRTLRQIGDRVSFRAGAGIVADSDAALELDETRAKARGLLRALGVAG
ncbi:MAG: aminodeoxychorismate synthase component I [Proteobacteria bacterium]|nr:aminodeoxychorismate synthase component I [Pseudomonadota bacterium]MBS0462902.1 aminodeoxychorismate synthase component I [Pseudomonadota bacterium]MBS0463547.1 aminodeoxychorismate synthase component I [Pseudomonadota bacterium]